MREHGRRWRPQVSISFKLIGFTATAIAAITGVLSYYFIPARRILPSR